MKMLFIPLFKEFFLKFASGEQDCEIRPLGHRGWNTDNVYPLRVMTLSNGYGKNGRLEKVIKKTTVTTNLETEQLPKWHIEAAEKIYGKRAWWLIAYAQRLKSAGPEHAD